MERVRISIMSSRNNAFIKWVLIIFIIFSLSLLFSEESFNSTIREEHKVAEQFIYFSFLITTLGEFNESVLKISAYKKKSKSEFLQLKKWSDNDFWTLKWQRNHKLNALQMKRNRSVKRKRPRNGGERETCWVRRWKTSA